MIAEPALHGRCRAHWRRRWSSADRALAAVTAQPPRRRPHDRRVLRGEGPAGAGGQLLRLPRRRADGRPAPRFARGAAQGRQIRAGDRARRSRQEPADPGRPADARDAEDAEGRPAEAATRSTALAEWVKAGASGPPPRPSTTDSPAASAGKPASARRASARRRTSSRRSSARSGRFSRFASAPVPRGVATRRGRRPTSIASSSRASRRKGSRRCAPPTSATLIRRATLDLTGLPPTPEEIDAFEKDTSPDAFAKVVDRLLASPRYGEAWGRLWLDVARYGEDDYRQPRSEAAAATTRIRTRISIATG